MSERKNGKYEILQFQVYTRQCTRQIYNVTAPIESLYSLIETLKYGRPEWWD